MARFLVLCGGVQFRAWVTDEGRVRTVHLAGRLGREHGAELLRLCDEAPGRLRIDLANLVSADGAGLEVLGVLARRGAELSGTSPYLALRLATERTAPAGRRRATDVAGGRAGGRSGRTKRTGNEEAR